MLKLIGSQLYAWGKNPLPRQITFAENQYTLTEILKHDFFAATALYQSGSRENAEPSKIILKLSRRQHFLGLPLAWLGEALCSHEISILRRLKHLDQTPRFLDTFSPAGFLYRYIEGETIDRCQNLPDDFFDQLLNLLEKVHCENIVYLDMNKKSNIILGRDRKPYLIDFQISQHIDRNILIFSSLSSYLRQIMERADRYHLFKHKRRLQPELLTDQQMLISRRKGTAIRLHRLLATPFRRLRRKLLKVVS